MHYLIYQRFTNEYRDKPMLKCLEYKNREELLRGAMEQGITLRHGVTMIIGPHGVESGTLDPAGELEARKPKSEVVNV